MNDAWGYQNDDNEGQSNDNENQGPKALREAYKAQGELLKQMKAQMDADRLERQQEKLAATFESQGVPGALAHYKGEADPTKAAEWIATMKATFGTGAPTGGNPETIAPALNADQQSQLQRMTEAGQDGVPMGGLEAAQAAIGNAETIQDLINASAAARHLGG